MIAQLFSTSLEIDLLPARVKAQKLVKRLTLTCERLVLVAASSECDQLEVC